MRSSALIVIPWALFAASTFPAEPPGSTQPPRRIEGAERVQVSLVLIDVVVRDRKDRPVSGLTLDDFDLIVDTIPVAREEIETFEETCPATSTAADGSSPAGAVAASAPRPAPVEPQSPARHSIVIYLDFSNLSFAGRQLALRSLRDHLVTRIGPSDRVMLLAFKGGLRLVQDFTSDRDLLVSRVEELRADRETVDMEVIEEPHNLGLVISKMCDPGGLQCTARRSVAATLAIEEEFRARRSLASLERLMPALAALPGRKALVLFTDALRQEPGVQYISLARSTPESEGVYLTEDILRLTREANAAGVSFYTVHASGLEEPSASTVQTSGWSQQPREMPGPTPDQGIPIGRSGTGGNLVEAVRTGLDSALGFQTTVATETGGRALQRTNDVGGILDTAQQDLSCHYVLGYRHAARGDGKRHSILVRIRPDPSGEARRGLTVRHRPYYTDQSPRDRTERLLRSAMDIPDLYRSVPVTGEAFALAPHGKARRVLIKASAPLSALSLIPAGESLLEGRVLARGEVTRGDTVACRFENEVPVRVSRASGDAGVLVYETGCVLEEGRYDLTLALMDVGTRDVGALRTTLHVPEARFVESAYLSEVHLWTRDPGAVLVSAGAGQLGIKEGTLDAGFIPRSERKMGKDQEAMLTFLLCPPAGAVPTADNPIRIRRTLQGEGAKTVADFRDLLISEPPDPETGCYQILNAIPALTLGEGVYTFTIELRGAPLGPPQTRQAALSVH